MKRGNEAQTNPGSSNKPSLKNRIGRVTLIAGVLLFFFGGGFEGRGWSLKTEGMPGLIRAFNDYRDKAEARQMAKLIFEKYKDSVWIKQPDQLLMILKQFRDTKDLPK